MGPLLSSCSPTRMAGQPDAASPVDTGQPTYLLIRSDDAGMSHSVNMGLLRLIESGLPVSVSVMFPTPWYQETVEDRKSTRLNSSHGYISYAVFCLKKKRNIQRNN